MQRSLLFALTIFMVFIGVPACARTPAPPINKTVTETPPPATDPTFAQAPAPVTIPTVVQTPPPQTSPIIVQVPAPVTEPVVVQAPAQPIVPPVVQAPALINPVGGEANPQPDLPANANVNQVLDALDQAGKNMKEFTAKVSLTEGNPDLGDMKTSIGQLWFQRKGADDGRIRVTFDKKRQPNGNLKDEKIEYLLDNGLLIDRNYRITNEDRRQVIKPGDKINLLKLGEGPFPLPIGQSKEDVYKEFDVKSIPPSKGDDKDLSGTLHLQLTPRQGGRFARRFATIDIWVSPRSKFPVQISTMAPNLSDQVITKLTDVKIDPSKTNPAGGLKDADFVLPPIDEKTWSIHTEKYEQ